MTALSERSSIRSAKSKPRFAESGVCGQLDAAPQLLEHTRRPDDETAVNAK